MKFLGTLSLAILLCAVDAATNVHIVVPSELPLRWSGKDPITYHLSPIAFGSGPEPTRIPAQEVANAFRDALKVWQDVGIDQLPPFVLSNTPWKTSLVIETIADHLALRVSDGRHMFLVYDPRDVLGAQRRAGPGGRVLATTWPTGRQRDGLSSAVIAVTPYGAADVSTLRNSLIHEVGHALGLGHSFIYENAEVISGTWRNQVDVMFPYYDQVADLSLLHANNRAWLSYLYRTKEFRSTHSFIRGILRRGRRALSGVNLTAVRMPSGSVAGSNPLPSTTDRFSCIAGFSDVDGSYVLPVQPGRYRIYAESLPSPAEVPGLPPFYEGTQMVIGPRIQKGDGGLYSVKPTPGLSRRPVSVMLEGGVSDEITILEGQDIWVELRIEPT